MSDEIRVVPIKEDRPDVLLREQLAAQALAVIQSHWSRPNRREVLEILHCMDNQDAGAREKR